MPGRKIMIFLVDGTSTGVRTAELGLSTIKALVVPRASLSAVKERSEVKKTGVYVLIGPDSDKFGQKRIYIGETDTIITRLTDHNKDVDKDFWDEAVIFVSKDENLTKGHARYLEARLIGLAVEAKRATVTNGTAPSEQGRLPEADEVEMNEFITQARLLLGALGYDVFEPVQTPLESQTVQNDNAKAAPPIFRFLGDGFDARCIVDINAGQFVVKLGSKARKETAPALVPTYKNLRDQLIQNGVLADFDQHSYRFTQDYAFGAATPAAQVVSGSTVNGRTAWRAESDNRTLADWQDALLQPDNTNAG
jgi:hypothetical protein